MNLSMTKFSIAMLILSAVVAFFGTLYAGYVNDPKLILRFAAPWLIWFGFFSVIWAVKS